METVKFVIDNELLESTDEAAKRLKLNRSELIREALRAYVKRIHIRELEEQERREYARVPDDPAELALWDTVIVWPEE